jgi:hypothetical protein
VSIFYALATPKPRHTHKLGVAKRTKDRTTCNALGKMRERSNAFSFKRAPETLRIEPQRFQPNLAIRDTFRGF